MNLVLDEAFEEKPGGEKVAAGMVVRTRHPSFYGLGKMLRNYRSSAVTPSLCSRPWNG